MQEPTTKKHFFYTIRTYLAKHPKLRLGVRVLAWLTLALVGVLAAISIVLHAWILPQIDDFRPKLEQFASQSLGTPVSIGNITTTEQGWRSEIELRQVRLGNAQKQGQHDLTIDTVQVAASPWRLLRRGVNRLVIKHPVVHVRRTQDGSVYAAGILVHDPKKEQPKSQSPNAALNWLLSQNTLQIQNGNITWHDATRSVAPLVFTNLNARLSNINIFHTIQAQLQTPAGWGNTIALQGRWRHGVAQQAAHWQAWTGKASLNIDAFNASVWQPYIDFGDKITVRQVSGKLNIHTHWRTHNRRDATIDATLDDVDVQFDDALPALALKDVATQLHINTTSQRTQAQSNTSYTIATKKLQFTTADGRSWKQGTVAAHLKTTAEHAVLGGSIDANAIDIGLTSHIGKSLPLQSTLRSVLHKQQPTGFVERLKLSWQGAPQSPSSYRLQAQGKQLTWTAQASDTSNKQGRATVGIPGAQGLNVDVDLTQAGGKLQLAIDDGHIELPGVFEYPRLNFDHLHGNLNWKIHNGQIQAHLSQLQLANNDLAANVQAKWHTQPNVAHDSPKRFPGILDLTGTIQRAKAEKVVRYLPLALGNDALRYVGASIRSGDVRNARIRIHGNVQDMPFDEAKPKKTNTEVFHFEVPLRNTEFAFMPRYLQKASEKSWPSLVKLNGLLTIDKNTLSLSNVTTRFSNAPDVRIHDLSAHIPNLGSNLAVGVVAKLNGSLQQLFDVTRTSPLSGIINQALDTATATGNAKMQLKLGLPINHMHKSIVQGTVQLNKNDVRITPETPLMASSTGTIKFDERGFGFKKIRTKLLGGNATLQGGTAKQGKATVVRFKAQGTLSGKGLRDEPTVNTVAALGKFMQGTTPYTAELNYRSGVPELKLKTNLVGMELQLPSPLGKHASTPLDFNFANTIYKKGNKKGKSHAIQDQVQLQIGNLVHAQYVRNLRPNESAEVIQGSITVGDIDLELAPELPKSGVDALILLEKFNADAWLAVLEKGWGTNSTPSQPKKPSASLPASDTPTDTPVTQETIASRYLPNLVDMQTERLTFNNLYFHELAVSGSREGRLWKLSLAAKEIIGHIEYLQATHGGPGAVKARLNRLTIVPANIEQISSYVRQTTDPKTLPMLDVQAKNIAFTDYKLDSLNVLASNTAKRNVAGADLVDEKIDPNIPNAWYIHNLNIAMPHSDLKGRGIWAIKKENGAPEDSIGSLLARQVLLQVRIHSKNLGALLEHLGYAEFATKGSGLVSGNIRWNGSPASPNLETLSGDMRIDVRNGSITKVNPGAAKFLGLLSLQGLTRLGDIAEKGFKYDRIKGNLLATNGTITSNNLAVESSLANVKASGAANLAKQTLQVDVVVLPKIDLSAAALLTSTINPVIGISSYLAQWIISKPLSRMVRQVLSITGSWTDPKVQKLRGNAASKVARRVLRTHDLPTAFDRLWDWSPITQTGRKQKTPKKPPATAPTTTAK